MILRCWVIRVGLGYRIWCIFVEEGALDGLAMNQKGPGQQSSTCCRVFSFMEDQEYKKKDWGRKNVIFKGIDVDVVMKAAKMVDHSGVVSAMVLKGNLKVSVKFRAEREGDLEFLRDHFGGYWYEQVKSDGQIFYWLNIQQRRFFKFMELVLPYLLIKKEYVQEILNYRDMVKENRNRRLTPDTLAARRDQMSSINYWKRETWRRSEKLRNNGGNAENGKNGDD